MKARAATVAVVVLAAILVAPAAHAETITTRVLLSKLPVRSEANLGYDRSKFTHWIDADHDGCDTRAEVLIVESEVAVRTGTGCSVISGRWLSVFDQRRWSLASDVDIDHHVALAEAWGSGAKTWSSTQRMRYANDLGYARSLNAMTDDINASKSDRDPSQWLPPEHRCRYVSWWMAVKYRWRLSIDTAERAALARIASGACGGKLVELPNRAPGDPGDGGSGGGNCDPAYPTVCIPPPPPDLDCGQIAFRDFKVLAPDPHGFDGDGDGIGCET